MQAFFESSSSPGGGGLFFSSYTLISFQVPSARNGNGRYECMHRVGGAA